MNHEKKQKCLQEITRKLVFCTVGILFIMMAGIFIYSHMSSHNDIAMIVFNLGLLGGFVSIQQRLPKIDETELKNLSDSWFSITLIPINGGVFALVLMLLFISGIIKGDLFPHYSDSYDWSFVDEPRCYYAWVLSMRPESSIDVAKLLFWSFVAGFSERFVPQIIRKVSKGKSNYKINKKDKKK